MNEKKSQDAANAIESILFVHGEPMAEKAMAAILGITGKEITEGLAALRERLEGRGLALVEKEGEWQLATHPDQTPFVEALRKDQHAETLSRAALETMAVVAYKGPMTRADIEYIRGVSSSFSLRTLLLRGLVERVENAEDSRSFLYRASFDFLKYLGLARLADLPEYEELRKKGKTETEDKDL
ncbi:MAG: SMC-Scp complex subunit ScpB [Candidatus Sungbacteria bacterium RIFCSPHIGHO2_01_FULL_54_26]|uniref:SMC-Scp complex subunit ScpB n=1 Tax=Candidatus Sungbacteria bacterium RIFCSPHIGHO2_02_FULL_53_17 TaxID=1802275 RepID=A0A1G2KYM6_9BACT|nr:MAG: SMC-Scp complex subunit ScpB [Candidatus Sungbacteria bacterium RIFCSPHIGHO2_01_FULL_54_26]OHA03592.1 MAG: SMC-Scp complex subunit ScpB [Candidatus Sungbacteria bacterium RIFCSPHIGHO2_02_FULL_53_17]